MRHSSNARTIAAFKHHQEQSLSLGCGPREEKGVIVTAVSVTLRSNYAQ